MNEKTKAPARKPFHAQLSETEEGYLQAIANLTGISKGQAVRTAIRTQYQMLIQRVPLCASGSPCFVPQMHQNQMRPISATVQGEFSNGGN